MKALAFSCRFLSLVVALTLCLTLGAASDGRAATSAGAGIITQARVTGGLTTMEGNGLKSSIEGTGGGYAKELLAIAILESEGVLGAVNKGGPAYCAFQIYHTNVPGRSAVNGVDGNTYVHKLLTDPAFCAKEGAFILSDRIRIDGYEGGICSYAGYRDEYLKKGSCKRLEYVKMIVSIIDNDIEYEVITDTGSADYGKTKVTTSRGEVLTVLNCAQQDTTQKSFAKALAKARESYLTMTMKDIDDMAAKMNESAAASPPRAMGGKIEDMYCLWPYFDLAGAIRLLISQAMWVEGFISAVIDQFLTYVCEYVREMVQGVLSAFCLPFPKITIGQDLESMKRTSCDGLSLGSVIAVQQKYVSLEQAVQWLGGLPPTNAMPTTRPAAPYPFEDIRLPDDLTTNEE